MTQTEFNNWWSIFIDRLEQAQKKSELAAPSVQDPGPDWDADFKTWTDEELDQLTLSF